MSETHKLIRVLLASQRLLIRAGLRMLLENASDIKVISEVGKHSELQQLVASPCPHVVLLDIHLLDQPMAQSISSVRRQCPETAILVLLTQERGGELATLVTARVAGVVLEDSRPEVLTEAVRRAARGEILFSRAQLHQARCWQVEVRQRWQSLTLRERQVLMRIAEGQSNQRIAVTLKLSEHTVETHVSNLLSKLGVASRTEAAAWVWRHGVREYLNLHSEKPSGATG